MSENISTTRPNAEGEMLWSVAYSSSYYDNDERMPGNSPVGNSVFVLAKGQKEALAKAEPFFAQAKKDRDKSAPESTVATIVTIEGLVAAEDQNGAVGFFRRNNLRAITLNDPDDAARYRLGVCLIPLQ